MAKRREDRASMSREQILKRWNERERQFRSARRWILGAKVAGAVATAYTAFVVAMRYGGAPDNVIDMLEQPEVSNPLIVVVAALVTAFITAGPVWWAAGAALVFAALGGGLYALYVRI